MSRAHTVIYCGEDFAAAKVVAKGCRDAGSSIILSSAADFDSANLEPCNEAIVMPDVPAWRRRQIEAALGDKVAQSQGVAASLPDPVIEQMTLPRDFPDNQQHARSRGRPPKSSLGGLPQDSSEPG